MQLRELGNSGLRASRLGLGALHFGAFLNERESREVIDSALDAGINFIDTGPLYGNGESESIVGRAISSQRDQVLIGTKVGLKGRTKKSGSFEVELVPLTSSEIRSSVERSLKRMNTDYIDLLQLHAFDPVTPVEETFEELARLVDEGKIRAVGCANYDPDDLATVIGAAPAVRMATSQCHYNMIERRAEKELIPACVNNGISVICYRTLARGILTGKYEPGQPPPPESRGAMSQPIREQLGDEMTNLVVAIKLLADEFGRTPTELALAWLLSAPSVGVVLIGTRNVSQLQTCVRASGWNLTELERARVDQIIESQKLTSRVHASPELFFEGK
jgi:aryl-alcohol dehydrogenase-like predicted oxidoreductase